MTKAKFAVWGPDPILFTYLERNVNLLLKN